MKESNREMLKELLAYLGLDRPRIESFFKEFNFPEKEEEIRLVFQNIVAEEGMRVNLAFEKARGDEEYRLKEYSAQLSMPPVITHATIGGLDTQLLDNLMAQLDWHFDYRVLEQNYTTLSDTEKASFEGYVKAIYSVIMLAETDEGNAISDALKIKYFTGTPYDQRFISQETRNKYIREANFYCTVNNPVTFGEARNLLCGRAVRKVMTRPAGGEKVTWNKCSKENALLTGVPFFTDKEERFPDYDLISQLKQLPIKDKHESALLQLLSAMYSGGLVPIRLTLNNKTRIHYIEAAPEVKGYNLYNQRMIKEGLLLVNPSEKNKNPTHKPKGKRP